MHIHMISRDFSTGSNRILNRLAVELGALPEFTASDQPAASADLNYFFPYLERKRFPDFRATPTASLFTHLDTSQPGKVPFWEFANQNSDLRLCFDNPYLDTLIDPVIVTPPLDLDKFTIPPRKKKGAGQTPVVGFSGFVYAGGRKGEKLAAALAKAFGDRAQFRASGKGWPVKTQLYAYNQLHTFFHALDLYVCTSTIEGIHYPTLEALACGVPVVIPSGVGILDTLPEMEGIWRYEAGNWQSLKEVFDHALNTLPQSTVDRMLIRGSVEHLTVDKWIDQHYRAFENLLYGVPDRTERPQWRGKCGVYIVAYGEPSRACAEVCVQSWKKHMPDVPIAVTSDRPLDAGEDIFIENPDEDIGGRSVKTKIYQLAPSEWEYVLYMDADTELVAPVNFLFDLLAAGWDMFICKSPRHHHLFRMMTRKDNRDEMNETIQGVGTGEIVQLNGGVFGFYRNPATRAVIEGWHSEWLVYGKRDQAALIRSLWANPLRLYVLGSEWNTVSHLVDPKTTAGILHHPMKARRWKGIIWGRNDSDEAARASGGKWIKG